MNCGRMSDVPAVARAPICQLFYCKVLRASLVDARRDRYRGDDRDRSHACVVFIR
jgi:hypothetical protein